MGRVCLLLLAAGALALACGASGGGRGDDPPGGPAPVAPATPGRDAGGDPDGEGAADAEEIYEAAPYEAPPPKPPDPTNVRACATLEGAPPTPITGVALYSYEAPMIALEKAYRVQLPARQPGHVAFDVATAGEWIIFAGTTSLTVFQLDGLSVASKSLRGKIPECVSVKGRHTFELEAGRYVLRVGPDPTGMIDVLITKPAP